MTNRKDPESPPAVTPYIVVGDARRAIEWYTKVFGAEVRGEPYVMADGSVGHAELAISDGVVMLADVSGEVPVQAPQAGTKHSHTLYLQIDDVDTTVDRARADGAEVEREPTDEDYGTVAVIIDPFGHRWLLNQRPADFSRQRHGDVGYLTFAVPDSEEARSFYGELLDWEFAPGSHADGWQVVDVRPPMGLAGGSADGGRVDMCYKVDDIEAAAELVRKNGGTAGDAEHKPYGLLADCTDNQGIGFQIWHPGE